MTEAIRTTEPDAPPAVKLADLDLRKSASTMGVQEARYMVDLYYQMQNFRLRSANQGRAILDEPHALIGWATDTFDTVERSIKDALGRYAQSQRVGDWALSIHGIGPVIAAGLLAHINVEPWKCIVGGKDRCKPEEKCNDHCGPQRLQTAGSIWAFAGLDPNQHWGKGEACPWNRRLKVLAWKIGQSFMTQHNNPKDFYGHIYKVEKVRRLEKNERRGFADLAAKSLEERTIRDKKLRKTLEDAKLPAGRIELQAQRKATKLFLSHYFEVAYECQFGERAPGPYSIEIQQHGHYIPPPNWSR